MTEEIFTYNKDKLEEINKEYKKKYDAEIKEYKYFPLNHSEPLILLSKFFVDSDSHFDNKIYLDYFSINDIIKNGDKALVCLKNNKIESFDNLSSCVLKNITIWHKNDLIHRDEEDKPAIISPFCEIWYKNGKIHRDNDNPAICLFYNNTKIWVEYGIINRKNNPAILNRTLEYMHEEWIENGFHNRINDLPAISIYSIEKMKIKKDIWMKDGFIHRELDKPGYTEETKDIKKEYYMKNGKIHREKDKPAIIENYNREWYIDDKLHRLEKPAIINGSLYKWDEINIPSNFYWYENGKIIKYWLCRKIEKNIQIEEFNGYSYYQKTYLISHEKMLEILNMFN